FLVTENEVSYGIGGKWGQWSHYGVSSLELIDPYTDNGFAANWTDSDESGKAPWTVVEYEGPFDLVGAIQANQQIELLRLGAGECLVDDVELLTSGSGDLVENGSFEDGLLNWTLQGNHISSVLCETSGSGG